MKQNNKNRRGDPEETEITQKKNRQCFEHNLMSCEAGRGWSGVGWGSRMRFGWFAWLSRAGPSHTVMTEVLSGSPPFTPGSGAALRLSNEWPSSLGSLSDVESGLCQDVVEQFFNIKNRCLTLSNVHLDRHICWGVVFILLIWHITLIDFHMLNYPFIY